MKLRTTLGLATYLSMFGCTADVGAPTGARIRIAHLSPDAPAVDVCLAPAGSGAFTGPVLGTGLAFGHVTTYVSVDAGRYDARIVAPGGDCAQGLLPDFTDLPALPDGATATIAAIGELAELELRAYLDDDAIDTGSAKLRFIHASPDAPAVDVGVGGGIDFTPVFSNVSFGGTQAHDDGYITTSPLAGAELSARATGTATDVIAVKPANLPAGSITTAFAIGKLADLRVLVCADSAEPSGLETRCELAGGAPDRARVRIAHLSPDAPAVDVCIARAGTAFRQPALAALGDRLGLAYTQVTQYVELPIAAYDIRVILATDTTCANAAVPDTKGVALASGTTATIAAVGVIDASGAAIADPRFRLAVFPDSVEVSQAKAKLRFVHASPGTPNVDVGIYQGGQFVRLFGNVEFGKFAVHGGIDPIGYLETDPITATVSARVTGSQQDALVLPHVALTGGELATAFAIGNKTGASTNPLRVLLCADNAPTGTLLAACAVAP